MSDSNALIPAKPPLPTTLGQGLEGFGELTIANMVLVQKSSREGIPGTFRDTLSGDKFDQLTIAPLGVSQNRVLFPKGELGADPLCKSYDGIVPVSAEILGHPPMNHECGHVVNGKFIATCPMASWAKYDRRTKTGDKPQCKEQARISFVEKDTGLPYRLTLNGMSLKPLKDVMRTIKRDAIMAASKGEIRNVYDYSFTMTPRKIDGKLGTFYVVDFGPISVVKAEDRGKFGQLYDTFVSRAKQVQQDADTMQEEESELEY